MLHKNVMDGSIFANGNISIEQDGKEGDSMKRQKRDRLERAQSKGFQAGINGRSSELCPYQQTDARSYWLGGWREGRTSKSEMMK
ncbi:Ribosome modulation factor [Salinivibrio sp. ES.052]|nr:Ribosome modulation factor [Salinivibrio sp. ES.052]